MSKRMRLLLSTLFFASFNTYAIGDGLYLGLMAGPAMNQGGNQTAQVAGSSATVTAKPRSSQFGSRIFAGYQMNPYFGIEGGFTYYSTINYNVGNTNTCSNPSVKLRTVDAVGKASLAFQDYADVYAKGGAAYTFQQIGAALRPTGTTTCGLNSNTEKIHPTASIGASYYFTDTWVADISWNRLFVGGPAKDMDLWALGLSYHFVTRYCGQFLCDD